MEGIEGTGPIKNNFSSAGLDKAKNGPTDAETLSHGERKILGEKGVAEAFSPLMSEPFSDVGTRKALERLSIDAVSSRN